MPGQFHSIADSNRRQIALIKMERRVRWAAAARARRGAMSDRAARRRRAEHERLQLLRRKHLLRKLDQAHRRHVRDQVRLEQRLRYAHDLCVRELRRHPHIRLEWHLIWVNNPNGAEADRSRVAQ